MRRIILLVVVVLVLVGTGIITVTWSDDGATVRFNKEKAKEETHLLVEKARGLKSDMQARNDSRSGTAP